MAHFRLSLVLCVLCAPFPSVADPNTPLLPAQLVVDFQLGGAYPPPAGVTVVVRDSREMPVAGLFNICYVDAFQSPPSEGWPVELLVPGPDGKPLADPDWPHDYFLDISTARTRAQNYLRVWSIAESCVDKGFSGVVLDGLDSYVRSKGHTTLDESIGYAKLLVQSMHGAGLAVGQENVAELGRHGRDVIGFDFAVTEGCHLWDQCSAYTAVYGDRVIDIEYADDLRGTLDDACAAPDRPGSLILRDRMMVPAGHIDYVFQHC